MKEPATCTWGLLIVFTQQALQTSLDSLVQLLLQLLLFGHGELGLVITHYLVYVRRTLCSVQHESPLLQDAALWLLALKAHLQHPGPAGVLAPGVCGHEGPLVEAHLGVVVAGPPTEQDGLCAHGRCHVDVEVAAAAGIDRDHRLDVLQVTDKVVFALAGLGVDGQHQLVAGLDFTEETQEKKKTELIDFFKKGYKE